MENKEDNEKDCLNCGDMVNEGKCQICSADLCDDCSQELDLYLEDWLVVSNKCEKCNKICCKNCIITCYQCENKSKDCDILCRTCSPNTKIACIYHRWDLCSKHKDIECPRCKTNKNYDRYNF